MTTTPLVLLLALLAAAGAAAATCTCPAAKAGEEVCGSDAVTYQSACHLKCAATPGLSLAHLGVCWSVRAGEANAWRECNAACITSYQSCRSCGTDECMEQCVYDYVVDCNCACKKYLTLSVHPNAITSQLPATNITMPTLDNVRAQEDSDKAVACYNEAILDLNSCSARCSTEPCVVSCITTASEKMCNCNPLAPYSTGNPSGTTAAPVPNPTTASTGLQPTASSTLSPLNELGRCNSKCLREFNNCQNACTTNACVEQCVYDYVVDCNCGCLKYLPASRDILGFVSSLSELPQPSIEKSLVPYGERSIDDAQQALDCYNAAMRTLTTCASPCVDDKDEACAIKCVKPAFETICSCNPLASPTTNPGNPTTASTGMQPSGSSTISPLNQLGRCNRKCLRTYNNCQNACTTNACVEQCVYDYVVDCNCGCLKYLPASRDILGFVNSLSELPQPSIEKSLAPYGERSIDDAQKAIDCYNAAIETLTACASPCTANKDEVCATKCVKPAFETICSCNPLASPTSNPGNPTTVSTIRPNPTSSGGSTTLSPLNQFGRCSFKCVRTYNNCANKCETNDCKEQCVYDYVISCNCGCMRFLPSSRNLLGFVQARRRLPLVNVDKSLVVFGNDRSIEDAQKAIDCYKAAIKEMDTCTEPCESTKDEVCATKCVRPAYEKICNCNPLQPYSSTSSPATTLRPASSTAVPRSTTRPSNPTSGAPNPPQVSSTTVSPTTKSPNSGTSIQSQLVILTLTTVVARVLRL